MRPKSDLSAQGACKVTKRRRVRITRSFILFTGGLVGISYETYYSLRYQQDPNSTLVLIFAAALGLPVYLHEDKKNTNDDDGSDDDPEYHQSTPRLSRRRKSDEQN